MSHSLLDPNQLHRFMKRLQSDGNMIQLLGNMASDNDFPDVADLAELSGLRTLYNIPDDKTGIAVFGLLEKAKVHPRYAKIKGDRAIYEAVVNDLATMGMLVAGKWVGVEIYKRLKFNPGEPYPIVLCHPALDGVYDQVKDLVKSRNYTAVTSVDEKPTAAVGSQQHNLNEKGLSKPRLSHLGTQIWFGQYTVEEGNEIKEKARIILKNAKQECKAKGLDVPSADDMTYVYDVLELRKNRGRNGKGPVTISAKPVGFENLDAYGLDDLLESTTDFNDPMALEVMEYSESEEDGKMIGGSRRRRHFSIETQGQEEHHSRW